jgi:2-polyprenyl-3-methyl-5-hydroxy-6-metoxy-1,4-benzoquinol methylase
MPVSFAQRSFQSELLDEPGIPTELLHQNLRELDTINRLLGGHQATLKGLQLLLRDRSRVYHIADIGCGGGDAIRQICRYAERRGFRVRVTGVDMNPDCVSYTQKNCGDLRNVNVVTADYRDFLEEDKSVDIIHCSLFCHHLDDTQLKELLNKMKQYASVGFIINDLHRHWFAYYSIRFLTRIFNGSKLVRNDAPLSVQRGFTRKEIEQHLYKAGIRGRIEWIWAFRYLITYHKN